MSAPNLLPGGLAALAASAPPATPSAASQAGKGKGKGGKKGKPMASALRLEIKLDASDYSLNEFSLRALLQDAELRALHGLDDGPRGGAGRQSLSSVAAHWTMEAGATAARSAAARRTGSGSGGGKKRKTKKSKSSRKANLDVRAR